MKHTSFPVWIRNLLSILEVAKKKCLAKKLRPEPSNLLAVHLLHHEENVSRLANFTCELTGYMPFNGQAEALCCGPAFRIDALSSQSVKTGGTGCKICHS
jgi:hypothetical protein